MKSATWFVVPMLVALLSLASTSYAVTTSIVPFTNDPGSDYPGIGISTANTYTHKLDFVDDEAPDTINSVAFIAAGESGVNWSLTNTGSVFGGGSGELLGDFYYGSSGAMGTIETVGISGLTLGTKYSLRFYTGPFGSRPQSVSFTNGADVGSIPSYDPDDDTKYLAFDYTAQGTSVSVTFTSLTDNNTFHNYAVTNQVVPEPTSLVLMGLGAIGACCVVRRRRAS